MVKIQEFKVRKFKSSRVQKFKSSRVLGVSVLLVLPALGLSASCFKRKNT